jgi:hypothetical protein
MKNTLILLMFFLMISNVFAQTTYKITEVKVNGNSIPDNAPIEFGNNSSVTVRFKVVFTKPNNLTIGSVVHVIGTRSPSGFIQLITPEEFDLPANNTGFEGLWEKVLYASDYSSSGENYLVSKLSQTSGTPPLTWESNKVPILKQATFTLSPTSLSLSCGDTSSRTFTVTPANIPGGATVTYQWSHPNWTQIGLSNNSITLIPSSATALPSNVVVIPIINGVSQPSKSCTVSRAPFSANSYSISGEEYVCSTGSYAVSNLPSNIIILSATSSNPNVASVSSIVNNQFTVTKVSDGLVTLSVVLRNQCNQTATITKQVQVGIPSSIYNATLIGDSSICGSQYYTYYLSGASNPCIGNIVWSVTEENLIIASETPKSVTVYRNPTLLPQPYAGLIKATVSGTNIEITKGVWVGVPNTIELSIQIIGAYELFAGTWTKLKANYVPLTYESNDPLDITFEWQIVNSMIRNYTDTAYKDVKPNNSGPLNIGVRIVCECGFGEWKYQPFTVGGTGPIVPIKPKHL